MTHLFLEDAYQHGFIILHESLKQSAIATKLVHSYLITHYQAYSNSDTLTLLIGQYCEPLARLMHATKTHCALYITGCNPHSQLQPAEINDTANRQLHSQLFHHSNFIFTGKSLDPEDKWPAEPSFLVLGIDLATSQTIGKQFGQNALVWTDRDAIPRLVLLR